MPNEKCDNHTQQGQRSQLARGLSCAGVLVVTSVAASAVVLNHSVSGRGDLIPWEAVLGAVLLTSAFPIEFHFRRETISIDLADIAMLVALVTLRPSHVLLTWVGAGVLRPLLLKWRPKRAGFNLAISLLSVVASLGVYQTLLSGVKTMGPGSWPAVVLVLLTYQVVGALIVVGIYTAEQEFPGWSYVRNIAVTIAVLLPLNASLGIVAAELVETQPWALLLLAGPIVVLAFWYRRADKMKGRYADLQKLYGFSVKLSEQSEAADVIAAGLKEARKLLHAQSVIAYLPGKTSLVRYELSADDELTAHRDELPSSLRSVVDDQESLLIARGKRPEASAETGMEDLVAAPIEVGGDHTGMIVLGDREGRTATFDNDDRLLLEALAANLGTAITSVRRHDALQEARVRREHDLRHDELTGLPNRSEFSSRLSSALAQRHPSDLMAVVLMDLDGFKEINDTVGHDIGDVVLKTTAQRLKDVAFGSKIVARLGGDEFALLLSDVGSIDEILKVAESARQAVSKPILERGLVLDLRASVGVAVVPLHRDDPLKCAEVAMYEAKRSHGGIVTYDQAIDHNTTRKLLLATELRRAMSDDELEVYYQPVAELKTGDVKGFEALLRWHHHHYGSVSPNEFIPVAEKTGLIGELTWWVMDKALRELRSWQDAGYEFYMAVNLSARSLMDQDLVGRLRKKIEDIGVRPKNVVLEITESSIMLDPERSERVLQELADLGLELAIDDYGTEYSSLSRLQKLPVTTVKIDRSFVMHMSANDRNEKIVRATIYLAHTLGQRVVAEGVEDVVTWERLAELGCDAVQGYYLSRPVPAQEARLWVENREATKRGKVRPLRIVAGA